MWPVQAHNTLSTIMENIKINQTSKKLLYDKDLN